ncbi:hypothetical protein GCM10022268_28400 [Sphingomonas cynarae]|uniref:FecR protein domain-containing protein n=1 Tax=Sphingomonas cynarae TaxID=930197 RepID=A0ABP7EF77_9SPHN
MIRQTDDMLHANGKNAPELAEALATWRERGRLSNEEVRALRSRRRTAGSVAGGASAILLAIGLIQPSLRPAPDRTATLQTGRGETKTVQLVDGTTLRLDGATRLSVRYGPAARDVTLAGGAAFFDVTHDPARPFTVHAGDGAVRVLGTAFEVDRTAGRMEVAVYRGAVRVAGYHDTRGKWVPAGWRGKVVRGHAGPATHFDGQAKTRDQGWLDVNELRLADLVTILNRQAGPTILPPPVALADLPISGRFRTDDPQSLLHALGTSYGFTIVKDKDSILLSE